jgi:predicted SprT family Zn-dependent metalloprotease
MELTTAKNLAILLMTKHGLLLKGWRFEFDNAKRRFGCCAHYNKTIRLSKNLVVLNPESQVKDTILHEIAHALCGSGHGHDWVWKAKAREVGCSDNRCYGSHVAQPESKYIAECKGCNTIHKRHKMISGGRVSSCANCSGGKFNTNFILNYIPNPKLNLVVSF